MRLLPIVRPRVRSLIAVTRDADSVLARSCHGWMDAGTGVYPTGMPKGTTDEADSALPAPTSSVVSALAIGDALALTLSRLKIGWDADGKERRLQFFHCHPGGQLGLQVRQRSLLVSARAVADASSSHSSVVKAAASRSPPPRPSPLPLARPHLYPRQSPPRAPSPLSPYPYTPSPRYTLAPPLTLFHQKAPGRASPPPSLPPSASSLYILLVVAFRPSPLPSSVYPPLGSAPRCHH